MAYSRKSLFLCVVLTAMNLLFIWGNSLMPGWVSKAFSSWVKDLLAEILGSDLVGPGSDSGDGLLRKLAHVTEFACLGVLLTWLLTMLGRRPYWVLAGGCLTAAVDETIQYFVPGRNAAFRDVGIDMAGIAIGLLVCWAVFQRRRRQKICVSDGQPWSQT